MRVIFRVNEPIEELGAQAGDRIIYCMDGRAKPISVVSHHPRSAMSSLTRFAHRLSLSEPDATDFQDLGRILRRLHAPPLRLIRS